jgi:hypothetical protein
VLPRDATPASVQLDEVGLGLMPGRPRETFDKRQKELARRAKQAAKRARRHGESAEGQSPAASDEAVPADKTVERDGDTRSS